MTSFNIYLLFLIGNIGGALGVLFLLTCIAFVVFGIFFGSVWKDEYDEEEEEDLKKCGKKWLKIFIFILCLLGGGMILCPTTEQLAVIYLLPKMSNSKLVNTLPAYAQTFLDLEIKKLKKETMEVSK